MKPLAIIWLNSAVLLSGCVHTFEVGREGLEMPRDSVLSQVQAKEVSVKELDASQYHGTVMFVRSDTLWLRDDQTNAITRIPMQAVKSIEISGSSSGPTIGGIAGGLVGIGIGLAIGHTYEPEGPWRIMEGFATGIGGVVGGAIGVGVGVIFGATVTAGKKYVFSDSATQETTLSLREKMQDSSDSETQGGTPVEYVSVIVKEILEETEASITIRWTDGRVTLPKSKVAIRKTSDGFDIRLPKKVWEKVTGDSD